MKLHISAKKAVKQKMFDPDRCTDCLGGGGGVKDSANHSSFVRRKQTSGDFKTKITTFLCTLIRRMNVRVLLLASLFKPSAMKTSGSAMVHRFSTLTSEIFRTHWIFIRWGSPTFCGHGFLYRRWPRRTLWLPRSLNFSYAFYFRTEDAAYEIYENKLHTKYFGFTVFISFLSWRFFSIEHLVSSAFRCDFPEMSLCPRGKACLECRYINATAPCDECDISVVKIEQEVYHIPGKHFNDTNSVFAHRILLHFSSPYFLFCVSRMYCTFTHRDNFTYS